MYRERERHRFSSTELSRTETDIERSFTEFSTPESRALPLEY